MTAAAKKPAAGRESICWRCQAVVLWRPLGGVPIPLSKVAPGRGDIAIQMDLQRHEIAVVAGFPTSWRRHTEICSKPSYSATAPKAKQR